jgi:signal peptidase complex subunit 3
MHTVWVRLNAVVFFGLTVLLGLSCLAAFSKIAHSPKPSTFSWEQMSFALESPHCFIAIANAVIEKLELNTLRSLKSHGGVDRALLSFDIKVDFEPAFHWNIKQVVLWDKIIESGDNKIIDESNVFVKYALVDQGDELRGKNVTLQLQWDHMPITGTLHMDKQPIETTSHFVLPSVYQ